MILCQKYIDEQNIEGLARIARNRGLPPSKRQSAWPLLLSSHPYAVEPLIIQEYPLGPVSEELVPLRRIKGDISRYRKRLKTQNKSSTAAISNPQSLTSASFLISHQHSQASTPLLGSSPTNTNTTIASNDSSHSSFGSVETLDSYLTESLENRRFELIEESIEKFLEKWGQVIPYESGMVWAAFALADWVSPVYDIQEEQPNNLNVSGPSMSALQMGVGSDLMPFSTIFEKLMLVILHSPAPNGDGPYGPYGPCDSPITDRISFFLSAVRKLLPDLASHFDEEDVLSSLGGDEWLIWWIKWLGAKVWDTNDRARIWDMYLGWRPNGAKNEKENCQASSLECEIDVENELGPDPFWNPMELESTKILDPHTQHLFVCLALLKSKKHTLMELDQSEIRECLGRLNPCKDIESIVTESGEFWRSWKWVEENDDDGSE